MELANVRWAQLEPGQFELRRRDVRASRLTLSRLSFGVGFKLEARLPAGTALIGMAADSTTRARWFGLAAGADNVAAGIGGVDLSTTGAAAFYTIGIDVPALERLFSSAPDAVALFDGARPIRLSRDRLAARRLRAAMNEAFAIPGVPPGAVEGCLVPLLSFALGRMESRTVERSKCLNRRLTAVRLCERYMREHVDAGLTLLHLSDVTGMRSRSLINAFEAVTGFSPMDYLKRIRLDGVRRALRSADKSTTRIIDVATEWGFWHMGHFAVDYRAMFGETPSQTLLA